MRCSAIICVRFANDRGVVLNYRAYTYTLTSYKLGSSTLRLRVVSPPQEKGFLSFKRYIHLLALTASVLGMLMQTLKFKSILKLLFSLDAHTSLPRSLSLSLSLSLLLKVVHYNQSDN